MDSQSHPLQAWVWWWMSTSCCSHCPLPLLLSCLSPASPGCHWSTTEQTSPIFLSSYLKPKMFYCGLYRKTYHPVCGALQCSLRPRRGASATWAGSLLGAAPPASAYETVRRVFLFGMAKYGHSSKRGSLRAARVHYFITLRYLFTRGWSALQQAHHSGGCIRAARVQEAFRQCSDCLLLNRFGPTTSAGYQVLQQGQHRWSKTCAQWRTHECPPAPLPPRSVWRWLPPVTTTDLRENRWLQAPRALLVAG